MAFFTPHGPYQSPPGYPETSDTDEVYGQMIDNMDRQTGRILDKLAETGLEENTFVVFISDQGASHMNPYKRDLAEGGLKVVCHATWPGHITKGIRGETPIISYDWFTTFADAGGGKIPQDRLIVGKDISGLFHGNGKCPHDAFYWHYGGEDAIRQEDWKLLLRGGKIVGLYDLSIDPEAKNDTSGEFPERTEELESKLMTWMADMCAKPKD